MNPITPAAASTQRLGQLLRGALRVAMVVAVMAVAGMVVIVAGVILVAVQLEVIVGVLAKDRPVGCAQMAHRQVTLAAVFR